MGVHLVLSVAIAILIPGLRSAARLTWTLVFWVKFQISRILRRAAGTNIHTPLVMVLALIPMLGGVAYLASRPLRRKLLIRAVLDGIASKLPFKLYTRMSLDRRLAPKPEPTA